MSHTDPITRPSLLMRLRDRGDHDAWSEFVTIYEPVIYRLAGRRSVQDAEASEIVQEVLIRVAKAIDRFDPTSGGSFRGWLSQTTRRIAVDRFRSLQSREQAVGGDTSGCFSELAGNRSNTTGSPASFQSQFETEFDDETSQTAFSPCGGAGQNDGP